jgi:biotin carboxylase
MTVFILGAGVMQVPAIRAAKELGWMVVAADANSSAPGARLADRFLPVDLKDREGLAAAARGIREKFGLDGVFTAGTDFSASVAWVARELGLPGIPFDTALKASDKLLMREALAAAGVSSPRYLAAAAADDPAIVAAGLGFPLVVKPADSMGARGCRSARDAAELAAAVDAALPFSHSGRVIVEEYIDGPEFSIDALVDGGEILIRGIADRHIHFAPFFVELGHTMPSAYPTEVIEEVLRVFCLGVRALGIRLGAAKGDMKYCLSRGRAVVGEIAARLSGGYMSGWTYPYASGIDVTREALRLCVGLPLDGEKKDRGWVSAERAFISLPGKVASIEGCVEAERMPYIKQLFLRVAPGDRVVFPANNVEKCGNVISQAPTREDAVLAAESAARAIFIRLALGESETEAFLSLAASADPAAKPWPPFAFSVQGAAAQELSAMPEYLDGGEWAKSFVVPFALAESVGGLDWSGRGYAESAELAQDLAIGNREAESALPRVLAGRFWRALARGGLQAAVYVLDTEALTTKRAWDRGL